MVPHNAPVKLDTADQNVSLTPATTRTARMEELAHCRSQAHPRLPPAGALTATLGHYVRSRYANQTAAKLVALASHLVVRQHANATMDSMELDVRMIYVELHHARTLESVFLRRMASAVFVC